MSVQGYQPALGPAPATPYAGLQVRAERLRLLLLWLAGATSSLVFIEPSPYEISSLAAIVVFAISGLALRATLLPLAILLILINVGYTISAGNLMDQKAILTWVVTSWYLGLTSLFFAAMLCVNTERRLAALMRGCMVAGAVAALAGLAGYFRLVPGAGELLLYDRARGTFKDPNVYGAFLILPTLLALQMMIGGRFATAARGAMLLGLFAVGILLSFSRAAWGLTALCGALVLSLTFLTSRSAAQRLRIILMTVAGVAALALLLSALLSLGTVADLFKERMSLDQSYDVGEQGRFGRHVLGALLALDVPLGIGPLQFATIFPEDPHNSYLNAFMSGGWISGVAFPALVLVTLAFGLRALLVPTPWQSTMIAVYAAYLGMVLESFIIDSDHWRHVFLLLGVVWGLIAATRTHAAEARAAHPLRAHASERLAPRGTAA